MPPQDDWERFINADHGVEGAAPYIDPMNDDVRFQKTEQVNKAIERFWEVYCSGRFEKVIVSDSLCNFLREMIGWLLSLTDERKVVQRRQLEHIVSRFEQYSQGKNQSTFEGTRAAAALFDWYVQKNPDHRERLADALLNAGRRVLSGGVRRTEIKQTWMQQLTGSAAHLLEDTSRAAGRLLLTSENSTEGEVSAWTSRFPGDTELIGQLAPLIDALVSSQFRITDDQARDAGRLYRALEALAHQQNQIALMSESKQVEAALRLIREPQRFPDPIATMFVNMVYRQTSEMQRELAVGITKLAQHNAGLFEKIADEVTLQPSAPTASSSHISPSRPTHVENSPEKQPGLQQLEQVCANLLPLDRIAYICRRDLRSFVRDAVNGRALMSLLLCGKTEPMQMELDDGYRRLQKLTHPDTGANPETQELGRCVSTLRELTGVDFNLANAVSVVQALQQASLSMTQASSVTVIIRPARHVMVVGNVSLEALLATQNVHATRVLVNGQLIASESLKETSVKAGDLVEIIVPE